MTDPIESSTEGDTPAGHASSASTSRSGEGLALALVVLVVFLVTSITGLALEFLSYLYTWPPSDIVVAAFMIVIRLHGHFAAATILVVPMAILRAVLVWKKSSKHAVRIVEVAAFVAVAIALWDPMSRLPLRELAGGMLSHLYPPPLMRAEPWMSSEPYDARKLLTAGSLISESSRRIFYFFHAVLAPLLLIGTGAVFILWRRSAIKKRRDPKG
jgi:hypothetical protein